MLQWGRAAVLACIGLVPVTSAAFAEDGWWRTDLGKDSEGRNRYKVESGPIDQHPGASLDTLTFLANYGFGASRPFTLTGSTSVNYDLTSVIPITIQTNGYSDSEDFFHLIEEGSFRAKGGTYGIGTFLQSYAFPGLKLTDKKGGALIDLTNTGSVSLKSQGTTVLIASFGTDGAHGTDKGHLSTHSGGGGKPGQTGGNVVFRNGGSIEGKGATTAYVGRFDRAGTVSVISAAGNGGHGGKAGGLAAGGHGGAGGRGGNGGIVTVVNGLNGQGTISSAAENQSGILALSIGGEGGSAGGSSIVSSGNDGGVGGNGGIVSVDNDGIVTTTARNATGIDAESIGGGGGAGSGGGWFGGSGDGGNGNAGKTVAVGNSGSVQTSGNSSVGIFASSTGGNGGDGGSSSSIIAVGASGGKGGHGGEVLIGISGKVKTTGISANGVVGQSVGGGGGRGGNASSAGPVSVSVGGSGGAGGNGGVVQSVVTGSVAAEGLHSDGLVLQSIGGGGGHGGSAKGVSLGSVAVNVSVGGSGGSGGSGGAVIGYLRSGSAIITGKEAFIDDSSGKTLTPADVSKSATDASKGNHSYAVLAQSIGGGGGKGGNAVSVAAGVNPSGASVGVAVGVGGTGGTGGSGGAVTINNAGKLTTYGRQGTAMVLQSIGGGGGSGGSSTTVAAGAGEIGGAVSVGIGGNGQSGGDGGTVIGGNSGAIETWSSQSLGILAQSIGGGGGHGGNVVDVAAALGENAASAGVGVGGSGGSGGTSVMASVVQGGTIVTQGAQSHGAVVQSIAGGGGAGGNVHSYSVSAATGAGGSGGKAFSPSVSVGGSGGVGGKAGIASLSNSGSIATYGANSFGVVVQSVGGGGGTGGNVSSLSVAAALNRSSGSDSYGGTSVSASVAVGGSGGAGGTGGTASFEAGARSSILTDGQESSAVVVQSIGGGGGAGGHAQSISAATLVSNRTEVNNGVLNWLRSKFPDAPWDDPGTNDPGKSYSASAAVGGKGGQGATGGIVDVKLDGSAAIETRSDHSHGVLAQSIGGGGGSGGVAHSIAIAGYKTVGLGLTIGGEGGSGNHGGKVTISDLGIVDSTTMIATKGDQSHGILAQSIGGGGGDGGTAGAGTLSIPGVSGVTFTTALGGKAGTSGDGGVVSVTRDGAIATSGANSHGIVAQSVGGGGGTASHGGASDGGGALSFSLGGDGGAGGAGGSVTIAGGGTIHTTGEQAHGLVAQSVGGGGGIGGASSGGVLGLSIGASVHLGGGSGSGSDGGTVMVTKGGSVMTQGAHAIGVLAQSVGGGGGLVGTGELTVGVGLDQNIHLDSGGSGAGGTVTVSDEGLSTPLNVTTSGKGAHAIFAQSVGGGGGFVVYVDNDDTRVDYHAPASATSGVGGEVKVISHGSLQTSGTKAYGILAQSAGGGSLVHATDSGLTILSGKGTSGIVDVEQSGTIKTTGYESHGIYAVAAKDYSSSGSEGSFKGAISVTTRGTLDVSGLASAAIRTVNGFSVSARSASGKTTTEIDVAAGSRVAFTGDALEGDGIYAEDRIGDIKITVKGTVETKGDGITDYQSAIRVEGTGSIDVASGGSVIGTITGSGGTVNLNNSGTIRGKTSGLSLYNLNSGGLHYLPVDLRANTVAAIATETAKLKGEIRPVLTSFGRFSGSANLLSASLSLDGDVDRVTNSLITQYSVVKAGENLVLNGVDIDFGRANATGNEGKILGRISSSVDSWVVGGTIASGDQAFYELALDAANAHTSDELSSTLSALDPSQHFHTTQSQASVGSAGATTLLSCGVATGAFAAINEGECSWAKSIFSVERNFETGSKISTSGLSLGRQVAIADHWRFGLSAGYQGAWLSGGGINSEGDRYLGGAALKYVEGPWLAATTIVGVYSEADASRRITTSGGRYTATSQQRAASLTGRLRLARLFELGALQLTPLVDFDAHWVHDFGYRETGAGALNLMVEEEDHALFDLRPALRLGTDLALDGDFVLRPYLEVGARFALNDSTMTSSLPDSVFGTDPVVLSLEREDVSGTVGVGWDMLGTNGFEAKLRYNGELGAETLSHSVSFKLGYKF
ncbi:hypothetical protein [uncultured Roseibium sp.]|uniref:hypothetical protein n=1 Tax=uncultured Roseibium sp. TaxID=1936171 RepID=UPI003217EF31